MKDPRLIAKLRGTTGETLVESLVAILVCAISAVMLVVATTSGARMNAAAQARDEALQSAQATAEQRLGDSATQTVAVTSGGAKVGTVDYTVEAYGSTETLTAYALATKSTAAPGYTRDATALWATVKTQKVTVKPWLSGKTVGECGYDVWSQELQKATLAAGGGSYPQLSADERAMNAAMSSGTWVWMPEFTSTGQIMLAACPATTSLGQAHSVGLVYCDGHYYKRATTVADKADTTVTDSGFDVSVLTAGGAAKYTTAWWPL